MNRRAATTNTARLKGVKLTHLVARRLRQPASIPMPCRLSALDLSPVAGTSPAWRENCQRSNDGVESRSLGRHPSPTTRPVDTACPWVNPSGLGLATRWTNDETDVRSTLSEPLQCLNCLTSATQAREIDSYLLASDGSNYFTQLNSRYI